jgi:hypothetical protein
MDLAFDFPVRTFAMPRERNDRFPFLYQAIFVEFPEAVFRASRATGLFAVDHRGRARGKTARHKRQRPARRPQPVERFVKVSPLLHMGAHRVLRLTGRPVSLEHKLRPQGNRRRGPRPAPLRLGSPAFSLPPSCLPHRYPPFLRVVPCYADLRVPRGFRESLVKSRPKKGFPPIPPPRPLSRLARIAAPLRPAGE